MCIYMYDETLNLRSAKMPDCGMLPDIRISVCSTTASCCTDDTCHATVTIFTKSTRMHATSCRCDDEGKPNPTNGVARSPNPQCSDPPEYCEPSHPNPLDEQPYSTGVS